MLLESTVKPDRYRWAVLSTIVASQTIGILASFGLPPLAPFIRADLDLSREQFGVLTSVYFAGSAIMSVPAGSLVDRVGVRKILVGAQLALTLFVVILSRAGSYPEILAGVFLAGLCFGALSPSGAKAVMEWFPLNLRATGMGIKQTGNSLGGVITAATLPSLALWIGWRNSLSLAATLAFFSAIFALLVCRDRPARPVDRHIPAGQPVNLRTLLSNPRLWLLIGVGFCLAAVQLSWVTYLALYLNEAAMLSAVVAGAFLAQSQVSSVIGRAAFGVLSDRLLRGRRLPLLVMLALASAILAVCASFLDQATPAWAISLLVVLFGFSGLSWSGMHLTVAAELFNKETAGLSTGINLMGSYLGIITFPPLFGRLADSTGSYTLSWHLVAGLAVLALSFLLLLSRRQRGPSPAH